MALRDPLADRGRHSGEGNPPTYGPGGLKATGTAGAGQPPLFAQERLAAPAITSPAPSTCKGASRSPSST